MDEFLNPNSVDFIGSSGTLVAAALETVGYFYQSVLMDSLSKGVAGSPSAFVSLGALLFIIGIIVVLINVVLLGKYKFSAWLLIGPSLFYASVFSRIETSGSAWEFGEQLRNNELRVARIRDMLGENDGTYKPRVSALFAWYNKVISSTVSGIVEVINGNKNEVDTSFFVRTQLYQSLGQSQIDNPGLRQLVHESFFGQCAKQLEYGRKMRDERFSPVDREWFANNYGKLAVSRRVKPKKLAIAYISELYEYYPALFSERIVSTAKEEADAAKIGTAAYRLRVIDNGSQIKISKDPSRASADATEAMQGSEAQKQFVQKNLEIIEETTGRSAPNLVANEIGQANQIIIAQEKDGTVRTVKTFRLFKNAENAALREIARPDAPYGLFTTDIGGLSSVSPTSYRDRAYSCHEIWQLVFASLHWQGLVMLRQGLHQGRENGAKVGDQIHFLHDMMVATRYYSGQRGRGDPTSAKDFNQVLPLEDAIVNAIAKKIFKNEVRRGSLSAKIAEMTASVNRTDHADIEQETSLEDLEAGRLQNVVWQDRLKAASLIESMPYYQGLILYFLAVLFPFFALLLIIPGKHSGFILWFILWFWAKSWDIAFAVVMMLDDVMHAVFIRGLQFSGAVTGLEKDLSLASLSIQEQDPTFQASLYYTLLSTAFKAIPFVTSYLIIGALKGGGSVIAEGMERYASSDNSIGRVSGIAGVGRMVHEGGALWNVKADLQQRRVDKAQEYASGDKGGAMGAEGGRKVDRAETSSLRGQSNHLGQQLGVSGLGESYESSEGWRGVGYGMSQGGRKIGYGELIGGMGVRGPEIGPLTKDQRKRRKGADAIGRTGTLTTGLQGIGNALQEWNAMNSDTAKRSFEARIGLAKTWADHDATGDAKSYKDAQAFILHGCIPIFSAQKIDHMAEATRIASEYENGIQYREGVAKTVSTGVQAFSATIDSAKRNRGNRRPPSARMPSFSGGGGI